MTARNSHRHPSIELALSVTERHLARGPLVSAPWTFQSLQECLTSPFGLTRIRAQVATGFTFQPSKVLCHESKKRRDHRPFLS